MHSANYIQLLTSANRANIELAHQMTTHNKELEQIFSSYLDECSLLIDFIGCGFIDAIELIHKINSMTDFKGGWVNRTTIPPQIRLMKNLEKLNLWGNRINSLPDELAELSKLKNVNLFDNLLDKFPSVLCKLQSLEVLNLMDNNLKKLPSEIGNLKNIQILDLRYNRLSRLPKELSELKKLERLSLDNNRFRRKHIRKIKELVPWCDDISF